MGIAGRKGRGHQADAPLKEPSPTTSRALAADSEERRRIGQDLHDGTQQRLVALVVGLSALAELIDSDTPRARRLAERLEQQAQEAIGELRAVVDGLQPPVLADLGLVHALHDISRSVLVPMSMMTQGVKRYDAAIEDAVYFTCREALQNTMKHAQSASIIWLILIDHGDRLEFSVEDNGPGFDAALPGNGFATMHHRVEALGGNLTITSSPGVGTRVDARIPIH